MDWVTSIVPSSKWNSLVLFQLFYLCHSITKSVEFKKKGQSFEEIEEFF